MPRARFALDATDSVLADSRSAWHAAQVETTLAIYEALIQANVPQPAARRVAEALEKDMTSNLATKQDLQHLRELMDARFEALEKRMDDRFEAVNGRFKELEGRFSLKMDNLESRIVIKLGALMTILIGLASALQALLR